MIKISTTILAALLLGACATELGNFGETEEVFGNAVRQNIAAQTVNSQGSTADVAASAARAAKASQTYATDQVEKPAATGTTSVGGSGN